MSPRFTLSVYPACAGIDLEKPPGYVFPDRLPRMRGDRPIRTGLQDCRSPFTPHARGSTLCRLCLKRRLQVYPACAGIDLHLLLEGC